MVKIMVKEFNVIVSTFSVVIVHTCNLTKYHFKAVVDGEPYHYRVTNGSPGALVKKEAFGRASVEIHYHAKNAGNVVRFLPVQNDSRKRKKEISDKQQSLF